MVGDFVVVKVVALYGVNDIAVMFENMKTISIKRRGFLGSPNARIHPGVGTSTVTVLLPLRWFAVFMLFFGI